jgi:hypothetical protein
VNLEQCIASWRSVLDDYEIIKWDIGNFDVDSVPFVKQACAARKWAFAADYIRLHALYEQGGIYLDADVFVRGRFDSFLKYDFFSAVEYHPAIVKSQKTLSLLNSDGSRKNKECAVPGIGVQAAVLGSVKGHPFVKKALEYYQSRSFMLCDGSLATDMLAPAILARCAEDFGFRYVNSRQELDANMLFLEPQRIASTINDATRDAIAVHCCEGSWRESSILRLIGHSRLVRKLRARKTFQDIVQGKI